MKRLALFALVAVFTSATHAGTIRVQFEGRFLRSDQTLSNPFLQGQSIVGVFHVATEHVWHLESASTVDSWLVTSLDVSGPGWSLTASSPAGTMHRSVEVFQPSLNMPPSRYWTANFGDVGILTDDSVPFTIPSVLTLPPLLKTTADESGPSSVFGFQDFYTYLPVQVPKNSSIISLSDISHTGLDWPFGNDAPHFDYSEYETGYAIRYYADLNRDGQIDESEMAFPGGILSEGGGPRFQMLPIQTLSPFMQLDLTALADLGVIPSVRTDIGESQARGYFFVPGLLPNAVSGRAFAMFEITSLTIVPEPGSIFVAVAGLILMGFRRRVQ